MTCHHLIGYAALLRTSSHAHTHSLNQALLALLVAAAMASTTTLPPQRRYQGKVVLVTGG